MSNGADMGGMTGWRILGQRFLVGLLTVWIGLGLISCRNLPKPQPLLESESAQSNRLVGRLAEVAPPKPIQELRQILETYQPQVQILSPRSDQVFPNEPVTVRLQARDLPIFQNPEWGLGPHLNVVLDDQPYQAVYDLDQTLVFSDLSPGSHTIRVFAVRPWNESFKNEGAYAQTTFHILTRTAKNNPAADQPLLTYNSPQDTYGTEPILLDFYLTNAPLHMIAQADPEDEVPDWRIRCTVNGERFVFDQWQPIYLKGFKPGMNWIQLELLDQAGNLIPNAFNDTVRLIEYEPNGTDSLSKIIRGELAIADIVGIVDPNYEPPQPEPEPAEPTELEPEAELEEFAPIPEPEMELPSVSEPTAEEPLSPPVSEQAPIAVPEPEPEAEPEVVAPASAPQAEEEPESLIAPELPADSAPVAKESVDQREAAPVETAPELENAPETEAELQPQAEPTTEEMESQGDSQTLGEPPAEPEADRSQQLGPPMIEPEVESVAPELSQPGELPPPPSDTAAPQKTPENLDNFYNRAQNFFRSGIRQIRDRVAKPEFLPADEAPSKVPAVLDSGGSTDLSPPEILPEALDNQSELPPNADTEPTDEGIAPELSKPSASSSPLFDEETAQPKPNFTENLDNFYNRAQNFFRSGIQQTRDRFSKVDFIPSEAPQITPEVLEAEELIDLSSPENSSEAWDDAPEPPSNSEIESSFEIESSDTLDGTDEIAP